MEGREKRRRDIHDMMSKKRDPLPFTMDVLEFRERSRMTNSFRSGAERAMVVQKEDLVCRNALTRNHNHPSGKERNRKRGSTDPPNSSRNPQLTPASSIASRSTPTRTPTPTVGRSTGTPRGNISRSSLLNTGISGRSLVGTERPTE